jgi:drug/metabolite transporter (DMT)-like permease
MTNVAANPPSALRMDGHAWLLLCVLALLWGCTFPIVKYAVVSIPPLTLVAIRVTLGALALRVYLAARGQPTPRGARAWFDLAVLGLVGCALPWCVSFWAQQYVTAGLGAIMNATTPLFGALAGHFLTRDEHLTPARLLGVIIGFAGVTTLIGPGYLLQGNAPPLPQLAFLFSTLVYALAGVYARRMPGGISATQLAYGQLAAAALVMVPLATFVERAWTLPAHGAGPLAAAALLALGSTALAFVIYFVILERAGATNVMLVTFLNPITAIFVGWLFLGEKLQMQQAAGMALIGLGLMVMQGRLAWLWRALAGKGRNA